MFFFNECVTQKKKNHEGTGNSTFAKNCQKYICRHVKTMLICGQTIGGFLI